MRGIKVKRKLPITSKINSLDNNFYITFNYTSTLEKIYGIPCLDILHIHGSLYGNDPDPIIGHGNFARIEAVLNKKKEAEKNSIEKKISIYKVINNYYNRTLKDLSRYIHKLWGLKDKQIDEINVVGHSVSGVDLPYFKRIDDLTANSVIWNVYFFDPKKECIMRRALLSQGIENDRIKTYPTKDFYDLLTN